jgi:hypothetical protein
MHRTIHHDYPRLMCASHCSNGRHIDVLIQDAEYLELLFWSHQPSHNPGSQNDDEKKINSSPS